MEWPKVPCPFKIVLMASNHHDLIRVSVNRGRWKDEDHYGHFLIIATMEFNNQSPTILLHDHFWYQIYFDYYVMNNAPVFGLKKGWPDQRKKDLVAAPLSCQPHQKHNFQEQQSGPKQTQNFVWTTPLKLSKLKISGNIFLVQKFASSKVLSD